MISGLNFYGLLKESEYRHNISNLNNNSKTDAIFEVFKYVADSSNNNPFKN